MNKQIRNLGAFFMVCYLALFMQLNRFAFFDTEDLVEDQRNRREILRDFGSPRGSIVTQDNELVAHSVPTDTEFQLQRQYPHGELYSHITGYFTVGIGSTGVESSYNGELTGRDLGFGLDSLTDHFFDDERVGNVTLSIRHDIQTQARDLLGGQNGSAVVLNPQTGAILGMYSNPTYDPNQLAVHDYEEAANVHKLLNGTEGKPLLGRTYQETFFPGSTFKIVTAAAGLESGKVTPEEPVYPTETSYTPPRSTRPIANYGDPPSSCGGALFDILAQSCNTSFMRMAVEHAQAQQMVDTANSFGFNADVPIDLPGAARSHFPPAAEFEFNEPVLALSAIGQGDVKATPLQMALSAAAVANEGEMPTPHVVAEVRDNDNRLVEEVEPDSWRTAMEPEVASTLRDAMVTVANEGTATGLREGLDGYVVGGKTGTAQLDSSRTRSHAWIIGFAGPPDGPPEVAVAVLVEAQEGASEQTGGTVAAPIAAALMGTALAAQEQPET